MKETKLQFCKYYSLKSNDVEVKLHAFSAAAIDTFMFQSPYLLIREFEFRIAWEHMRNMNRC